MMISLVRLRRTDNGGPLGPDQEPERPDHAGSAHRGVVLLIERCSCGAELLSELHFCVECGAHRARRPAFDAAGRIVGPPSVVTVRALTRSSAPVAARSWPASGYPDPAAEAIYSPTPSRSSVPWIVASAAIVVVSVLTALAVLTLRPVTIFGTSAPQPAPVASPSVAAPVTAPVSSPAPTRTAPSPSSSATTLLTEQVDRDRLAVESVTGTWVPQLSSKRPGTVDSGVTYSVDTILSHFRGLAVNYPNAALLWSGDWPVFGGRDYWVVIVTQPFSTAAAANAWCDAKGFDANDCMAKKLSHIGGPQGTTVPRS